jgi:hypothetical protein
MYENSARPSLHQPPLRTPEPRLVAFPSSVSITWQGFAVRATLQRITPLLPIEPMQALRGYALPRRLTRF